MRGYATKTNLVPLCMRGYATKKRKNIELQYRLLNNNYLVSGIETLYFFAFLLVVPTTEE